MYCKVKDRIQREKTSHTIRSRYARAWIVMDGMETPFVWSLSLYKFFWDHGYLFFFFFYGPSCAHIFFFLFFSILGPSCVHIFFSLIAHASLFFNKNWRERPTHIVEHFFVEWVDGTMLTSQRSIARGYMVCMWILIMKAWREFSQGSQQFDKTQYKNKQHMCLWFSGSIIIWL